ncbi:DUF3467 domain-containing protein [Parahaliea maris]|uniref:DUF3467 domain-containing protein n=1 Tax=Parahaliea maris TaxID=2716870 RepID=A0A5C9A546_9GAMM|nr:DUF3467 domain-containing protein [Parahaliea maris]TXS95199.1 DUF3467 domain-containing protein [Parahaliea maris]
MVEETRAENVEEVEASQPATPIVDWDDSAMVSSHANVVNATSTREEVNLFFGTNETWKASETREFHVKLNNRIVLSPYAAKRLWILLGAVLTQYEKRFGALNITPGGGVNGTSKDQGQVG